jgi:hypothetical protein
MAPTNHMPDTGVGYKAGRDKKNNPGEKEEVMKVRRAAIKDVCKRFRPPDTCCPACRARASPDYSRCMYPESEKREPDRPQCHLCVQLRGEGGVALQVRQVQASQASGYLL